MGLRCNFFLCPEKRQNRSHTHLNLKDASDLGYTLGRTTLKDVLRGFALEKDPAFAPLFTHSNDKEI